MASGFLLYGMSMMYGATGSLDIGAGVQGHRQRPDQHQVLVFGLVFIVAGLAFKLGAVPFHMWIPDVYQGAPTAVTLHDRRRARSWRPSRIAIRLLVEGLSPLALDWQQMLIVLAVGSLLIGNLAAIAQTNLKRMLAYSTIAQMGFVLLGLPAGVVERQHALGAPTRYSSAMFYIVTYVLTTLGELRHHPAAGARRLRERGDRRPRRPEPAQPAVRRRDGGVHVLAGRRAAAGGLLRQAGGAAGAGVSGKAGYIWLAVFAVMHVADRRLLLPARGEGDVLRRADHRHHGVGAGRRARSC